MLKDATLEDVLDSGVEKYRLQVSNYRSTSIDKDSFGQLCFFRAQCTTESRKLITGIIKDVNRLEPIIGANVVEKGTTNGTITDVEGRFSLNVAPDATLREVLP